jgi:integrase
MYAAMRRIGEKAEPGQKLPRPTPTHRRLLAARQQHPDLDQVLAASTIRRVHATLMSAPSSAVRRRRLVHNPAEHVQLASGKAPKAVVWTQARAELWQRTGQRYPVAVWTGDQAGAFLDHVAGDRLYAIWHLIPFRGLRRSEAASLAWADVDLVGGTARIAGTKSDTSRRTITLDSGTVEELRAHRARQLVERLQWGPAWADTGRVFTREDATDLQRDSVSDRFDRLLRLSGLPPIRLHDPRHTAASLTYRATRDLKLVAELLGQAASRSRRTST